jgi:N-acetylmuramoyl-L-alanine amidase
MGRTAVGRSGPRPGHLVVAVVGMVAAASIGPFALVPLTAAQSARLSDARAVDANADGSHAVTAMSDHLIVASSGDRVTGGYWLTSSDGGVFAFGAPFEGSAGALPLVEPVVGMAPTRDAGGYWLVASDGGVFAFGDAPFLGSMGGRPLNRPIVGMAATADGGGYWMVASDGGVFAFGDAPFLGSMGGRPLNRPIVGMAATADGGGYWMVASDGGVFAFGDAPFLGSTGSTALNSPVVGALAGGTGYRLVAGDGGLFSFGAPFAGSAVGLLRRSAVSLDTSGNGYRVVSADGSVYAFGGAAYLGSVRVPPLADQVITVDPGHNGGNGADPGFINRPIDGGGFTETCDTAGTETGAGYSEHAFAYDVALRLAEILKASGASVVLTRSSDSGLGPCIDERAAVGNAARSDAAVSIHGDGGPVSGRGFAVDVPVPVTSPTSDDRAIVPASRILGTDIRDRFLAATGEPVSDYSGSGGITPRSDLGGLNLSTVPKVLVECANMANPTDAALMADPGWRQLAAQGLADGISGFLVQRLIP